MKRDALRGISLFSILFFLLISFFSYAQQGEVRGSVYDKKTGEPLIFISVGLQGTTRGAATDVNGFYSITLIEPGSYILFASALGYDSIAIPITISSGQKL